MQYEMTRIYRHIIQEVLRSVEEESESLYIDIDTLKDIERNWYKNLTKHLDALTFPEQKNFIHDDEESEDSDRHYTNLMMCLYDKVTKSKNRWRCVLKQGFINIGNVDFAFNTAHGDLDW
ncbi:Transcription initiation factor IIA large subunit [Dictyocoela muelleri]|nr:Transcription initiation factor IIA large subunit [Dictyocoela muelleri]